MDLPFNVNLKNKVAVVNFFNKGSEKAVRNYFYEAQKFFSLNRD